MRFESLIFDIDGTLWDSRALVAEGYNLQLKDEGLLRYSVDAERLRPLFGKTMGAIADVLFPDLPTETRYSLMERCMERENRHLEESDCHIGYPQIERVIRSLSKHHRLFIVSNSQQGYPELCMEKLGITDCFSGHLCYGDTGTSKGQTIRTLMEQFAVSSCAYIGDTQGDLDATLEAGIPFIWAAYGFGVPSEYDIRLNSPEELLLLENEGKL